MYVTENFFFLLPDKFVSRKVASSSDNLESAIAKAFEMATSALSKGKNAFLNL